MYYIVEDSRFGEKKKGKGKQQNFIPWNNAPILYRHRASAVDVLRHTENVFVKKPMLYTLLTT